ncbi:Asp-tRNA(Asn)/Glu-tRNA(Gln) amidotransferase subunit GatB, partial [Candidatus Woesearchaeota archaeon]|nr:Asp-tRNA(Asn)/Glu-tRNA(Gln) amidotransferase subunit GatB [Candidatus Woesearchaeota archaeon]
GLTRIHLEEDPAALVHPSSIQKSPYVLVDYNRSGNPLIEIVTEPDMEGPEEARDFMKQLITVLEYLEIFDSNTCILKADANVSIKESGYVRAEVKNITGFKEIERALNYEVARQKQAVAEGKKLKQETRGWDSANGVTFSLRAKETEEDYGYIVDPDLTVVDITKEWIAAVRKTLPELAADKVQKFISKHKIPEEDAKIIAAEKELAELFELVAEEIDPVLAAKWLRRELMRVLNYSKKTFAEVEMDERHLIDLLKLVESGKITEKVAQKLLEQLVEKPFDVKKHVEKEKLGAVSDTKELEKFCKEAIAENPKALEDYRKGNEKALNFVVGAVMKKSRGKATPKEVNEILKKLIQ